MKNNLLDQIIEQSFGTEPDFQLPDNFAQRITSELERRSQWKIDLTEYLYLTAFAFLIFVVVMGTFYFVNKETLTHFFTFISVNWFQVVLVTLLLNFILFADRVLLPLLFTKLLKHN